MVLSLPDGKTKTVGITQDVTRRYWFGICPVSSKIGNLKMCGGCKWVGYVGKEEQKEQPQETTRGKKRIDDKKRLELRRRTDEEIREEFEIDASAGKQRRQRRNIERQTRSRFFRCS